MEELPSYQQAIDGSDWLTCVASYIPVKAWPACCLVNHRFYHEFAPRLWQDPLVSVRHFGLHPNDDLVWYRRFINKHMKAVRLETRCLVRSLDFRDFALRASGLYSTEASERAISESFRHLPEIFPELIGLLVEGHPELDPGSFATPSVHSQARSLSLLDLARCQQEFTPKLFSSPFFRGLVYLDVSHVPGSMRSAIQASLNPDSLPNLRILKSSGHEMDDATAILLFQSFRLQLWSLDLSRNKLTDKIIDELLEHCFPSLSFHCSAHFVKEGELVLPKNIGSLEYGPFHFVRESQYSASFQHPERYLADVPVYSQHDSGIRSQEWQIARSDGLNPLNSDTADDVKNLLLDEAIAETTKSSRSLHGNIRPRRGGLTHLCLNGNGLSLAGIERLLRLSSGRLEHFECDQCFSTPHPHGKEDSDIRSPRLLGFFNSSHLLRPVISSSLRSLRLHHSVVTQVPTMIMEGLPAEKSLRLSEEVLFKNICRAFPLAYIPDMNPRMTSLTLTGIPARSTGPFIERLTRFLDLASAQQRAIKSAGESFISRRGPSVLKGLRVLRLELEPALSDDSSTSSGDGDGEVDFDRLLDPGDDDFSSDKSKGGEEWGITSRGSSTARMKPKPSAQAFSTAADIGQFSRWTSGRLRSPPYSETDAEYITHRCDPKQSWTGNVYTVPVWIGPGTIGPHAAVNEYMWNLQDPNLRTGVGPATPDHVAAGVPSLSYIFYAAWDAMILPQSIPTAVKGLGEKPSRDVANAIKEYRLRTKGTPDHWEGKIQLVHCEASARYHSSEFWR
ncbi:hypothetical protein F4778DRAFT_772197 [Xylariomycetidae sp. FL2044]|nr:hypothetical protein F4778DRAFT_772197 [Xylariomycetidae sp. FL2044]